MWRVFNWLCAVVPHITDAIQEWVERVAKVPVDGDSHEPDVCIVEVMVIISLLLFGFVEFVSVLVKTLDRHLHKDDHF